MPAHPPAGGDPAPRAAAYRRGAPGGGQVALRPGLSTSTRLHVVTGKGGVGKTTVAAALTFALARLGAKVLLVEVEGRQAIAQLFDHPALPYGEQRLASAGRGEVWGLAIDAEAAMIEYLELFYGMKRSARGLQKMGAVDFVTTLAPGLRDVLLTGKVKEAVTRSANGRPSYDAVVLDAPPTGRIVPFLNATAEVANLTKGVGPINRQSAGVVQLLHGPRTAVHLVTLLEEMPVQETVDAAAELTGAGYHLGAVIVNRTRRRLLPRSALEPDARVDTSLLAAGLAAAGLPEGDPSGGALAAQADALAAELHDYAVRQRIEDHNAERLRVVAAPRIVLPEVRGPVELAELNELASCLFVPAEHPERDRDSADRASAEPGSR